MSHEDFVRLYREGALKVSVNDSAALQIANSSLLPKRYQAAHHFWSWVWMLSIPGFIAVSVMYKWWVGLLLLFFVTPALSKATKRSASEFTLEHALESEEFFRLVVEKDILSCAPTR